METLVFRQDIAGSKQPWRFPANSMSDGTLRALGILVALYQGGGSGRPSVVGIEEPEVARYIALVGTAGGFQLPDPASGQNDRHIEGIQAPGLLSGSAPVVFFRTRHTKRPRFSVRLNATRLTQYTFVAADPAERSFSVPPANPTPVPRPVFPVAADL